MAKECLQHPFNDSISEKIITIRIGSFDIEGTLLSSNTRSINQKLAIIIVGSGQTDRDGNSPLPGGTSNNLKMLAENLAGPDLAVFRYDKRGVGKSRPADFNRKYLRFEDYINEAERIFDYMHDSLGFKDIWYIGHSEGSDIAINAAQQRPVRGVISLSGSAVGADESILRQIKDQLPSLSGQATTIVDSLRHGIIVNDVPKKLSQLFAVDAQPYWISWMKHVPAEEIKTLNVPILIIHGTCDKQVAMEDAMKLKTIKPESKLVIIENMTHDLKDAKANCRDDENPSRPLNALLVKEIKKFLN